MKPKNPFRKYLILSGIAAQMGITIYLGAYFGKKLDEKYPNEKHLFTVFLTLFSVFVALFIVVKQIKSVTQNE